MGKLAMIAKLMRSRLDEDGLVTIDEHLGDVAEAYNSILWLCTDGAEGENWGVFADEPDNMDN